MRNYILLLCAIVLAGCDVSDTNDKTPDTQVAPLVITAQLPAIAGKPTRLTATLTPADSTAYYHWSIGDWDLDASAVISYTFPEPGDYDVVCKAYDEDLLIIARDTLTVTVVPPDLDLQQLIKFKHVEVAVFAELHHQFTDKSGTRDVKYSNYAMWLDASSKPWVWQGGNLVHDHAYSRSGTDTNTTPDQHWQVDSTEHLAVTIEGNVLKKIEAGRMIGYKEYTDQSTLEEEVEDYATELRDLTLVFQNADSTVFLRKGPSLKDRMTYRSTRRRQGERSSYPYVSTYDSTAWFAEPLPYARVVFH
jgi:hypothetical protein